MKKFFKTALAVGMTLAMAVPAFAADGDATVTTAPKIGEVTVNITKTWAGDDDSAVRPESITVNVGEKTVTLTADEAGEWKGSVVVDAFDVNGATANYTVSEDAIELGEDEGSYVTTINPKNLEMQGFEGLTNSLGHYPRCNETEITDLKNYNMLIFKKGKGNADVNALVEEEESNVNYVVWTATALTENAKEALKIALKDVVVPHYSDPENLRSTVLEGNLETFVSGYDAFNLQDGHGDVKVDADGIIHMEYPKTWSWIVCGNVAMAKETYDVNVTNTYEAPEEEPEYGWIPDGGDTATGMGEDIDGKNWFMKNSFDVADWEIGDCSEPVAIQAGNPKNGTNSVGTYSVMKTGENKFQIVYGVNSEIITDEWKVELNDPKIWMNCDGNFISTPGNQKGHATKVGTNEFEFTGNTLHIFAHFDAAYYVWGELPAEVSAFTDGL